MTNELLDKAIKNIDKAGNLFPENNVLELIVDAKICIMQYQAKNKAEPKEKY